LEFARNVKTGAGQGFDFDVSRFARLPKAKGLFVTGTDTGVGKTLIAGAIARRLCRAGRYVEVFKPVATGCRRTHAGLVSEDAEFLAACADSRLTLAEITPVRFSAGLAPTAAAERERRQVDLEAIFASYERICRGADVVVVEGIGGLLCPISKDFWVIHLAAMMHLPVVIVARAGLGTINHTLLTIHAASTAGLSVAGVVVNRYRLEPPAGKPPAPPPEPARDEDLAMYTNPSQIAALGGVAVLAIVPEEPANSVSKVVIGPNTQFAVDQVDWAGISGL